MENHELGWDWYERYAYHLTSKIKIYFKILEFFTKDLSGDASKLIKNQNILGQQPNILNFELKSLKKLPSNLLGLIQVPNTF